MVALASALGACGGDGCGTTATTTATLLTTTTIQPVVTTAGPARSEPPAATRRSAPATTTPAPTSPTKPAFGGPCALGRFADCIDPDGDGQGTYLSGGAACIQFAGSPELCSDLDGDGAAGYPDSG